MLELSVGNRAKGAIRPNAECGHKAGYRVGAVQDHPQELAVGVDYKKLWPPSASVGKGKCGT
jgi:hypothetical protein